jgi:hypothetical protein
MRNFITSYFLCHNLRSSFLTEIGRRVKNTVHMPEKFVVLIVNDFFNSCVQYVGKISNFLYQLHFCSIYR